MDITELPQRCGTIKAENVEENLVFRCVFKDTVGQAYYTRVVNPEDVFEGLEENGLTWEMVKDRLDDAGCFLAFCLNSNRVVVFPKDQEIEVLDYELNIYGVDGKSWIVE